MFCWPRRPALRGLSREPSLGEENLPSCLRDTKAPHAATHVASSSKTWSIQFVCFLMFAQESRSLSELLGLLAAAFGKRGGPTSSDVPAWEHLRQSAEHRSQLYAPSQNMHKFSDGTLVGKN